MPHKPIFGTEHNVEFITMQLANRVITILQAYYKIRFNALYVST